MASSYERELRAVLAGSADGVRAVTRSCTELQRARAMQVIERPFLVVRAAGSGMDGSGDLLALRGDICFPIEVKTRADKKVYLSGQMWDQYESMRKIGERCALMPLYAHRLKGVRGDSWRIFRIDTDNLSGPLAALSRRIPTLPLTRTGKPHLDWDEGLPLHQFLGVVCRTTENNGLSRLVQDALSIKIEVDAKSKEIENLPLPSWMERFHS
ncbi:MAG: hypothetical protein QF440_02670 [Candidatus Thalassarchaeaceae archaeon]|nr:hypothetical protein [Candidatus Thalassarchaeaceae archaeon]